MTLLLCSRNESVRKKWFSALSQKWVVHQAASVVEMASLLTRSQVEVILLHRSLVDEDQLREICSRSAGKGVFVFSDRPDNTEGVSCLRMGCVGYANTYMAPMRLKTAMEAVQSGLVWVGSGLMQLLIKELPSSKARDTGEIADKSSDPRISGLSKREYQLAGLVADGLQNGEIAAELEISERTVKAHLSSIYSKTGTRGRLNLALLMKTG